MSRLSKFLGKPEKLTIGDEVLDIYPLTVANLDLLLKMGSDNVEIRSASMKELIKVTLKKAVPDSTDEEIDNLGLNHFNEIVGAIMKANGLETKVQKNLEVEG